MTKTYNQSMKSDFLKKLFHQKLKIWICFLLLSFTKTSFSQSGSALNFDGVNDVVNLGTTLGNFGTSDFTIETWIKTSSAAAQTIIEKRGACAHGNMWSIRIVAGKISFEVDENAGGTNYAAIQSTYSTYADGFWHHLACTRSGATVKMYINGALIVQANSASTVNLNNANNLGFGNGTCGTFTGNLDETRIWNVARSAAEIQTSFYCETPSPTTGLVAHFHYNQGTAGGSNTAITALTDDSGNNTLATLANFALTGATSNFISGGAIANGQSCIDLPFQLNGNGGYSWNGGDCYQLTDNGLALFGSMWYKKKADLNQDFDLSANLNFGTNNSPGADGFTFAFQNQCISSGTAGQDIGIGGVIPSFEVEFDTYQNGVYSDPTYDHIAIQKNGVLNHNSANALVAPVQIDPANVNVETGLDYLVRIYWTHADSTLKVYVNGNLRTSYTGGIVRQIFGNNPYVYWGFTAATGGEFNRHTVCMVNIPNNVVSLASAATICASGSYQANVPGYTSYSWSPSIGVSDTAIANPILAPSSSTTYTLTVKDACNNVQTQTIAITVNPIPNVSASGNATVCAGTGTPLTASGASTYSWSPTTGLSNAGIANPIASPLATTTYTVTGTSNGCSATANVTINVNSVAVTTASGSTTICNGSSAPLTASGATTYSWSPSNSLDNASIANPIATPTTTTVYTVTGTAGGCSSTDTVTVVVNPIPTVTVSSLAICEGQQATVTATVSPLGGVYSWNTGGSSSSIQVSPSAQTNYSVTYTVGGCTNNGSGTVDVNPVPVADAGTGGTICPGGIVNLNANGGTSYSWSPAAGLNSSTVSNPAASPSITTVYTVTVGNSFNCTSTDTVTVNVIPLAVDAGIDATVLCGTAVTLGGSGGVTYSWSPLTGLSNAAIANPTATPNATTTYTLTATNGSCSASDSVTITILGLTANAGNDVVICNGQSTQLNATVTASNGIYQTVHDGYTFSTGSGSYNSITGGTVLWNSNSPTMDDVVSGAITIPAFTFDNHTYTSLYVSSNGFITFGSAPLNTNYTPLSSTQNYAGCISAYGQDLGGYTFNSEVRYQLVGTSFIIQWKNVGRYSGNTVDEELSFQIILNTTNNQIAVVYSSMIWTGSSTAYPQVGLRGASNTFPADINNRSIAPNTGYWLNLTTAGTSNASTCAISSFPNTTQPQGGTVFYWTPQIFVQPTYSWSPNTGLSNSTIANPTASPSNTTLYTLSVNYGTCSSTSVVNVTIDPCLGVQNNSNESQFAVFPNPAANELNVHLTIAHESSVQLVLVDITGQEVLKETVLLSSGNTNPVIDTRNLADGIYFLTVKAENLELSKKVSIQH